MTLRRLWILYSWYNSWLSFSKWTADFGNCIQSCRQFRSQRPAKPLIRPPESLHTGSKVFSKIEHTCFASTLLECFESVSDVLDGTNLDRLAMELGLSISHLTSRFDYPLQRYQKRTAQEMYIDRSHDWACSPTTLALFVILFSFSWPHKGNRSYHGTVMGQKPIVSTNYSLNSRRRNQPHWVSRQTGDGPWALALQCSEDLIGCLYETNGTGNKARTDQKCFWRFKQLWDCLPHLL